MRSAAGVRAPTYVDDLVALVRGPRQAARAQVFLLAAGHGAGLLTERHACGCVQVMWDRTSVRRALEAFPIDVREDGGAVTCRGICPNYMGMILQNIVERARGRMGVEAHTGAGWGDGEGGASADREGTPIR